MSTTVVKAPIGGYIPSAPLAYIGLAAFALVTLGFVAWSVRYWKKYTLALTIGTGCMAIGFGVRIATVSTPSAIGPYIGMTLFILLSPCALLANNYMILPRLAKHLGHELSLPLGARVVDGKYRKPRMAKFFVWSDVITFWLQAGGGGLTAAGKDGSSNLPKIGNYIALVGLALQLLSFATFIVLLIRFGRTITREDPSAWTRGSSESRSEGSLPGTPLKDMQSHSSRDLLPRGAYSKPKNLKAMWWAMLFCSAGLMIRSIFRVAEYATGREGYLLTHEWCFYTFDSLPIIIGISMFLWFWPPRWMPKSERGISSLRIAPTYV